MKNKLSDEIMCHSYRNNLGKIYISNQSEIYTVHNRSWKNDLKMPQATAEQDSALSAVQDPDSKGCSTSTFMEYRPMLSRGANSKINMEKLWIVDTKQEVKRFSEQEKNVVK